MSVAVGAVRTAILFGVIGFLGGFFGPMLLDPDGNQGPMLGIFITGPLGFLLGLVWGAVRTILKERRLAEVQRWTRDGRLDW